MRRLPVHLVFGAATLALGLYAAREAWALRAIDELELAVAQAHELAPAAAGGDANADARGSAPQARLAHALALAAAGKYDAAATAYKELTGASDGAGIHTTALYDLANLHLRTALQNGEEDAVRLLPLIELAKQNYREVLHIDPMDWDARYNLERALWLAPAFDEGSDDVERPTGPRESSVTTMQGTRGDLP